ncbi:unnamed protein product, partial [Rotaria sp. Silwood2]
QNYQSADCEDTTNYTNTS